MSLPDSLKLLRILDGQGTREIDVMGGEPLLLPWIPDFAAIASEMGMKVNISTNGSCRNNIARFRDSDTESITIGVSLEGSSEKRHNTITKARNFSLALETIGTLLSFGFDVPVKTVVNRTTAPDIGNIIGLLKRLGIRRYYLIHMDILTTDPAIMSKALSYPEFRFLANSIGEADHEMEILTVSASCFSKDLIGRPARCSGGVNKLSILPDGSVFPCNLFHGSPAFRLGNILHDNFDSIWANSRLDAFRKPAEHPCTDSQCSNRQSCTGGCPAHNYYHYGNLHTRDVRCGTSY